MRRLVFTVVWVLLLLFNETKVIYAITKIKPPCTHCIHADECFVFFIVQLTRIALHQRVQFTLHCSVYLLWARAVDIFLFVVNTNGYRNLFPHLQIRSYRSVFQFMFYVMSGVNMLIVSVFLGVFFSSFYILCHFTAFHFFDCHI